MSRYAVMKGDEVVNVALWDGETEWKPDGEIVQLPDDSPVSAGWTRSGNDWVAPPLSELDQAILAAQSE